MSGAVAWGGTRPKGDVWPTAAQDLLLRAALLPDARALDAWREVRGRVDVAALDGPSQAVLPALRRNLTTLGVEDELMSLFKGVHRFTWARNQVLLHRMLPVVAALERAGVPTMLLKGAAFVVDARLDAGTRAMNDVDVLVPTDRAREAIEVLLAQGLVPVGDAAPWYLAAYSPRFVPSHAFRDGGDRQLDLHWHVLHASGQPGADDDFWAAAVPAELLGVRTRTLCPTDELLLVILHGLRWNAIPTYRWVIDATVLLSGAFGAVDFDRLVGQARKRRVVPALAAGLRYLRDVADVTVPDGALRALRAAGSSPLERFEFRTQMIQPRHRGVLGRLAVHHQQYVRRQLALGEKATVRRQVALARAHLGVSRVRDVRHVLRGGTPGPGRPPSEVAAAVGTGTPDPDAPAVQLDRPIDFGVAGTGRRYVAHGTWRPDADGCWIAGREARLVLPLSGAPPGSLVMGLWADGFLGARRRRQRLEIRVNDRRVAALRLDAGSILRGGSLVIPPSVVTGDALDVLLRTPDAVSAAELGVDDDDRRLSVFLRRLELWSPPLCEAGVSHELGEGAMDERMLAGGWGEPEPFGRWTLGARAQLALRVEDPAAALDLEFDAVPARGRRGRRVAVDVAVNGRRLGRVDGGHSDEAGTHRMRIPRGAVAPGGELLLTWRIRNATSPFERGVSADRRRLGLFVRRIALVPR